MFLLLFFLCGAGKQRRAAIPQTRLLPGHFRMGIWQRSLCLGLIQPRLVKPCNPGRSTPASDAAGPAPGPPAPPFQGLLERWLSMPGAVRGN